MIRKGDEIKILPEFQDAGDDIFTWLAVEDEDGGRVRIVPLGTGLALLPNYIVETRMIEAVR